MARRRRSSDGGPERDPGAIVFLSLNMILLAFFILLVALSQPNRTKEAQLAIEVRKAFQSFGGNYLGLGQFLEQRGVSRTRNPIQSSRQVEQFLGELTRFIEQNEQSQAISYEVRSEGMSIHVSQDFAFAEGSAQLLERSRPIFTSLYNLLLRTTNPVRIEGHTDNREIQTRHYRDAWALSAARAMAVFRFFTASGRIPTSRIFVVGYGGQRPRDSNLTAAGRAANRRVTITLVGPLRQVGEP